MKKYNVTCPYCNKKAVLQPANFVHGVSPAANGKHLYVCGNWPKCDAYVSAHEFDLRPMGTLANGNLRNQRILAHRALERYRKATGMSRDDLYFWLGTKLNLHLDDAHVAKFNEDQCRQVIALCARPRHRRIRSRKAG